MSPQSALSTIAEVAIAIAGFGGVIAAIASVAPRGLSGVARSAFRSLLTGSIMIVVFSVLPQVVGTAGVSDELLWRSMSALHVVYVSSVMIYREFEMRAAGGTTASTFGWVFYGIWAVPMLQAVNAIWFGSAWVYLAALLALVLLVFTVFPRLLGEIWATSEEVAP